MIANRKETVALRKAGLFFLLGVILLTGITLRLSGIGAGLPLVYFGDEVYMVNHAVQITWNDPNPHMFVWGSFPFYLIRIVAALSDWIVVTATGHALCYADYYFLARGLSATFSVGTILLVFYLGKHWGGWMGGLLSASVMAFSSYAVVAAHYATSEPILGFWATLGIMAMMRMTSGAGTQFLPGVALGLAVATKYNAAVLVVPLGLIALMLEWPNRAQPSRLRPFAGVCGDRVDCRPCSLCRLSSPRPVIVLRGRIRRQWRIATVLRQPLPPSFGRGPVWLGACRGDRAGGLAPMAADDIHRTGLDEPGPGHVACRRNRCIPCRLPLRHTGLPVLLPGGRLQHP